VLAEDLQTKKDAIMDSYKSDGTSGWESTDNVESNKNTEKVE
jgi:hypothetical protein